MPTSRDGGTSIRQCPGRLSVVPVTYARDITSGIVPVSKVLLACRLISLSVGAIVSLTTMKTASSACW